MSSRSSRRSSRNRKGKDNEIVAPGFGTAADVERLSRELGNHLPENAVTAMMRSEGRGIRRKSEPSGADCGSGDGNPLTSPTTSNAWADFIQEEGVSNLLNFDGVATKRGEEEIPSKRRKTSNPAAVASSPDILEYDLTGLSAREQTSAKDSPCGCLVQSGTLDASIVGRKPLKSSDTAAYHLVIPTVLLPSVAIAKVCTSCNAAHAIAIDQSNQAYGWGRNEGLVLGNESNVTEAAVVPTPQLISNGIQTAALGKSHTLFLKTDGTIQALGQNKSGQCGWKQNVRQSGSLKACSVPGSSRTGGLTFVRIACGEDFSLALDDEGIMYSTGSSEYGQLGNGETGEYFVTANKLAYTNAYGFCPQRIFHHGDGKDSSRNDQTKKTIPIPQDIRLQDIVCGKHHALALEAPNTKNSATRIFSWGCGDYGCLGHGRQQDEYFPRHVEFTPKGLCTTKLAAGGHCSLVLTKQGHVYYWGQHKQNSDAVMKPQLVDALANNQHIVTHVGAGSASVACTTDLGNTVVWGQGPYGELGLGPKKSSAKPAFVDSLSGIQVLDMACGQGSTIYVVKEDESLPRADLPAIEAALK